MNSWIWILLLLCFCNGNDCRNKNCDTAGCKSRSCDEGKRDSCPRKPACDLRCDMEPHHGCREEQIQPRNQGCDCDNDKTMPMPIFAPETDCGCNRSS